MLVAILLSVGVFLGWNFFFPPPPPPKPTQEQIAAANASAPKPVQAPEKAEDAPLVQKGRDIRVKTPLFTAVFDSQGGTLGSFELLKFREKLTPDAKGVNLVGDKARAKSPLSVLVNRRSTLATPWTSADQDLNLAGKDAGTLTFSTKLDDGRTLERKLHFSADSYIVKEELTVKNTAVATAPTLLSFTLATVGFSTKDDKYNLTRVGSYSGKGLNEVSDEKDLAKGLTVEEALSWGAVESNYFLFGFLNPDPEPKGVGPAFKATLEAEVYRAAYELNLGDLAPGESKTATVKYFLGPKDLDSLAGAGSNLSKALDLGWFTFIARPILRVLTVFYGFLGNYGLAIILLTICAKALLWPLSAKSYKSMEQMKKIQPLMTDIREKYKDDREKMNEEMMRLYKTYKVNPAGGCVPMFLQIPVFLGLYNALLNAIELRHSPFIAKLPFTDMVWLADLSVKDPYYITPIIMGGTMFLQQKLSPQPGDPTQAKIMLFLPIVFTFMFLGFPAGLVIYWLVNNVLSILQQQWMLRGKR